MQLDPNAHLLQQLQNVSGTVLERLTAATFASVGYTVFRNLRFELAGQMAAEADILASVFTPLRESRVFLECKGGDPSFTEIREFASLRHLLWPEPDDLIIICRGNCPHNRHQLAAHLKVRLVEKPNLLYYVLPLLGGSALRLQRARELNRYLAWQVVHEYLVGKTNAHPSMHLHYRFLVCDLWKIGPPEQQVDLSFEAYTGQHSGTSDIVAAAKGTTALQAVYDAADDDFEAAMYVVLLHRFMNVYAIVRRTLEIMQKYDSLHLIIKAGGNLRQAVSLLSSKARFLFGFPSFLQTYFFVWGGFLVDSRKVWEIEQMARESGTTPEAVELYLEVLKRI